MDTHQRGACKAPGGVQLESRERVIHCVADVE